MIAIAPDSPRRPKVNRPHSPEAPGRLDWVPLSGFPRVSGRRPNTRDRCADTDQNDAQDEFDALTHGGHLPCRGQATWFRRSRQSSRHF
jgi:hypothetical protein